MVASQPHAAAALLLAIAVRCTTARRIGYTAGLVAALASPAAAQEIRGRVVDERSRQALADAAVTLLGPDSTVLTRVPTGSDGFFTIRAPAEGRFTITIELIGYAPVSRAVSVSSGTVTVPAFVLNPQAIELDSIQANVTRRDLDRTAVGFTRASQIAAGERLARLERQGARMITAVRELSGVHVREWNDRNGRPHVCVEHRRRIRAMAAGAANSCEWVVLVVDGITLGRDEMTFRNLGSLQHYESVELLSGVDANRYGMDASAYGALVLWTRGRGPYVDPGRNKQ